MIKSLIFINYTVKSITFSLTCLGVAAVQPLFAQDAQPPVTLTQSAVVLVNTPEGNTIVEGAAVPANTDAPTTDSPISTLKPEELIDPEESLPVVSTTSNSDEIQALVEAASGLDDIALREQLNFERQSLDNAVINPVVTTPTPNAIVKAASETPEIFKAFREILISSENGLSDEERMAINQVYRERNGALIFVTDEHKYKALEDAKGAVASQGLPASRYDFQNDPNQESINGKAELEFNAAAFIVRYGNDMERGIIAPNSLGEQYDIIPEGRGFKTLLETYVKTSDAPKFFADLEPQDPDYAPLKAELNKYQTPQDEEVVTLVPETQTLKMGSEGEGVKLLRIRLEALGFAQKRDNAPSVAPLQTTDTSLNTSEPISPAEIFDDTLLEAVQKFQTSVGLKPDGVAGPRTIGFLNQNKKPDLAALLIALERHRWGPQDRAGRQIVVNIASFMAEVRDDNVKAFQTRVVVGQNDPEYRTPEFHDTMEFVVINPKWNVPWSIATEEFLPKLQNGGGIGKSMKMLNNAGKSVDISTVDFGKYTKKTFPYRFVQDSGPNNALGKVKFIFPNKHNIYLHDTPAKGLFAESVRAFSHGCVRVSDPVDLATFLLGSVYENPRGKFDEIIAQKDERYVELTPHVPVYLTYFTTFVSDEGQITHVRDIYKRDQALKDALSTMGLELS